MRYQAISITRPNQWEWTKKNLCDIENYANVRVAYSSICSTDLDVIAGSLGYYRNGLAKFPVTTGHEWCGYYGNSPVVGLCILKCDDVCEVCSKNAIHCPKHLEVGVLNKDGAHAEYVQIPSYAIIEIPSECKPCFALTEPLAVVLHGINRAQISNFQNILIVGYGNIGKLTSSVLKILGYTHDISDPAYFSFEPDYNQYDLIIECSGNHRVVNDIVKNSYGSTILAFGFAYDSMSPESLMTHEINFISTLGSSYNDFVQAVSIIQEIAPKFDYLLPLSDFDEAIRLSRTGKKVVLKC